MALEDSAAFQSPQLLRIDDREIVAIPDVDSGEPMVSLLDLDRLILPSQLQDPRPDLEDSRTPYARVSVKDRLRSAIELLPDEYVLVLVEAQRTVEHQRKVYADVREELSRLHQPISEADLDKLTRAYASDPDIFSPHVTGGAVDVAIARRDTMTLIDMGGNFEHDTADATYYPLLTDQQKANRNILIHVMTGAGFVNYEREWWHWSYGDKLWAFLTGQPHALYGPAPSPVA